MGHSIRPRADEPVSQPTAFRMTLLDILSPASVMSSIRASGKKQVIQDISTKAGELLQRPDREIFETLLQRERLGSTGVGNGIAIPHGKLPKLDRMFGLFARLEKPVDFEALDGAPVDLVFLLLAPESAGADHLKALARVARLLRDSEVADRLRAARDQEALYALLTQAPAAA